MTEFKFSVSEVVFTGPGEVEVRDRMIDGPRDGEAYVETEVSGISTGTELSNFLDQNPKGHLGWDPDHRLFRSDIAPDLAEQYPMVKGYMNAGVVKESRRTDLPEGTRIATRKGHASGYILGPNDFWIPVPDDMPPELSAYVAQMGPVSMNGILYAADEAQRDTVKTIEGSLEGQRVLVLGAGVVGLLEGMMAQWAGAKEVIVADRIGPRLQAAANLGMTACDTSALDLEDEDHAFPLYVKSRFWDKEPLDTGADFVFQCTGSDTLLHKAFAAVREQGTIIDLGFYQAPAHHLRLGEESHHNSGRRIVAQIGSVPRGQRSDWSRRRLSEETISFMGANREAVTKHMITHRLSFEESPYAYAQLAARDESMLQVILRP